MTFLYFNYKLRDEYPNPNDIYAFVEENKTDTYLNRKNKEFLNIFKKDRIKPLTKDNSQNRY